MSVSKFLACVGCRLAVSPAIRSPYWRENLGQGFKVRLQDCRPYQVSPPFFSDWLRHTTIVRKEFPWSTLPITWASRLGK